MKQITDFERDGNNEVRDGVVGVDELKVNLFFFRH
jgi:hypothetical protein